MLTWYVVSRRKKITIKMAHDSFMSKFVFHKIHESIFTLKLQWIIFIALILLCYQQPTIIKKKQRQCICKWGNECERLTEMFTSSGTNDVR